MRVVWINGPFGAGKTTVAEKLVERWSEAILYDPELIGTLLQVRLWREGDVHPLLALDIDSFPVDLNERGQVAATLSALGMGVPRAAVWTKGTVRRLGRMSERGCDAWDLNERGVVTGVCRDAQRRDQPVVWKSQQPTRIRIVWGDRGVVLALNDEGQVIGYTRRPGSGCRCHAFVWENGRTSDLGTLGGRESSAIAVNSHGQIVGVADTRSGQTHAVLWTLKR